MKKHVSRLVANNKYRETPKFERSRNVELRNLALDDDDDDDDDVLFVGG